MCYYWKGNKVGERKERESFVYWGSFGGSKPTLNLNFQSTLKDEIQRLTEKIYKLKQEGEPSRAAKQGNFHWLITIV